MAAIPTAWQTPEVIIGSIVAVISLVTLGFVIATYRLQRKANKKLDESERPAISCRVHKDDVDGWHQISVYVRNRCDHRIVIKQMRVPHRYTIARYGEPFIPIPHLESASSRFNPNWGIPPKGDAKDTQDKSLLINRKPLSWERRKPKSITISFIIDVDDANRRQIKQAITTNAIIWSAYAMQITAINLVVIASASSFL